MPSTSSAGREIAAVLVQSLGYPLRMANREHVAKLLAGADTWNSWSLLQIDVADFRDAELSSANLMRVDLGLANLTGANLTGTDLTWANLGRANLTNADLSGARCTNAKFIGANLTEANLTEADLQRADFTLANLTRAKMAGAYLYQTKFINTIIREVSGLNLCKHSGQSSIDFRTLAQSGILPLPFLRGCGLPDVVIDYLPSLLHQAIQFHSCFISYSTLDEDFAIRLHADLQNNGVRCWFAPHDIQGGKKLHEQIDRAIQLHDRLLLILSKASMDSQWVKIEIARAIRRERADGRKMLFPVRLVGFETLTSWQCFDPETGKDSAAEIREYYVPDFSNWKKHDEYVKGFDRLMRDLKAEGTENEI